MPCTELQRIRRELQHIIDIEEREIEVLGGSTGDVATTSAWVRRELVRKLRKVLNPPRR